MTQSSVIETYDKLVEATHKLLELRSRQCLEPKEGFLVEREWGDLKQVLQELSDKLICENCLSRGFQKSKIPNKCEFCDGTFGGNVPTSEEINEALVENALLNLKIGEIALFFQNIDDTTVQDKVLDLNVITGRRFYITMDSHASVTEIFVRRIN